MYLSYDLLLIDNSKDDSFFKELKSLGVNVERIEYCEPARERIIKCRNILKDRALKQGYDYFLSLEVDLFIQPDTIKKLLSHNKDIVSGYYGNDKLLTLKSKKTGEIKKVIINMPLIYWDKGDGNFKRALPKEVLDKGLIEVGATGVGCLLISKGVLGKISFRYIPEEKTCDDFCFCSDAKKLGYKIYLDSGVVLEHEHHPWGDVKQI